MLYVCECERAERRRAARRAARHARLAACEACGAACGVRRRAACGSGKSEDVRGKAKDD